MILVFGKNGQVARELQSLAGPREMLCLGRAACDLSDPAQAAAAILTHQPRAVINASAYTAVDMAEQEERAAHVLNAEAPSIMARTCANMGIPFLHISTDYVFDGQGTAPFTPSDKPDPQNAYGRSKWAGERAVAAAGGAYAILRTSWVFSEHGSNFVKTMLRLAETRDALNVVSDQIGGPTPARAIASACLHIAGRLDAGTSGTYHFSGAPDVSWADFARAIFEAAGKGVTVSDIPTSAYPTAASRPLNSRLDCSSLEQNFGLSRPSWRAALKDMMKESR